MNCYINNIYSDYKSYIIKNIYNNNLIDLVYLSVDFKE